MEAAFMGTGTEVDKVRIITNVSHFELQVYVPTDLTRCALHPISSIHRAKMRVCPP